MPRQMLPFLAILPPLVYSLISLFSARSFFARQKLREPQDILPITILKPLQGDDPESFENFVSFCRQDYPSFQLIFAVASSDDTVVPVVERIMHEFPSVDIELIINGTIHGANRKVSNLINAFSFAKHDIIVVCDSDVRVKPDFLRQITMPFADPQVGLVSSLYRTSQPAGFASSIEATGFTVEMMPNVMVARQLEGLTFALGAAMAVRRAALDGIGGFLPLADLLADDYHLGNKVYRAGWQLELTRSAVESIPKQESLASVISRQVRWGRTMRVSRPGGFFATVVTQPFPAALLALYLAGFSATGWSAVVLLCGFRSLIVTLFSRVYLKDFLFPRLLPLLPLRDAISFLVWILAFAGNTVSWRGRRFRIKPGGTMAEL